MKLAEVYIEHSSLQLDQSFSYLCGHAEVRPGMRVSVPFAKQQLVGFVDSVKEVSADELKQMPYELKEIQRVIDERPLLNDELLQLGKWMAEQYVAPLISCYQAMLPGVLKPKSSARSAAMEEWACFAGEREGLSKRQREVLDEMKQRGSMRAVDYRREYKSVARKLIELGCVRIEKRKKVPQLILSAAKGETLTLCAQQSEALAAAMAQAKSVIENRDSDAETIAAALQALQSASGTDTPQSPADNTALIVGLSVAAAVVVIAVVTAVILIKKKKSASKKED